MGLQGHPNQVDAGLLPLISHSCVKKTPGIWGFFLNMQKKYVHFSAFTLGFIVVLLYWPGLGGTFFYDDYSNLNGLSSITNLHQLIEFVFSGNAGPLGRPIALLTFGLQSAYWPGGGAIFSMTSHFCFA